MKKVEEIYSCHAKSKHLQFNKKITGCLTEIIPHNTIVFSQETIHIMDIESITDTEKNLRIYSELLHLMIIDFLDRETSTLAFSESDIAYATGVPIISYGQGT